MNSNAMCVLQMHLLGGRNAVSYPNVLMITGNT